MGNTHGMFRDSDLSSGVTDMGKPACFYFFRGKPVVLKSRDNFHGPHQSFG